MVDRVIRVIVDPSGARTGLAQVDRSAKQASGSLGGLKTAALGVVAALGVREIIAYADAWVNVNNRLKLVTTSSQNLTVIQNELIDLSRETRSGLEDTVELFSRFRRATLELGITQREQLNLTKSINQAIQISGATATEASAAVIQFAQGLASGALRGDELRSVLEQTPRLARALAEGLGVGIGQLRELGAQGALTAEAVVGALRTQAGALQEEFDQTSATIGSGLTAISDSFLIVVGRISDATGASTAWSGALFEVAQTIDLDIGPAVIDFIAFFNQGLINTIGRLDLILNGLSKLGNEATVAIAKAREESGFLDSALEFIAEQSDAANATISELPLGLSQGLRLIASPLLVAGDAIGALEESTTSVKDATDALNESLMEEANILAALALGEEKFKEAAEARIRARVQRRLGTGRESLEEAGDIAAEGPTIDKEQQTAAEKLLRTFEQQAQALRLKNQFGEDSAAALREEQILAQSRLDISDEVLRSIIRANEELTKQEATAKRIKDAEEERIRVLDDLDAISDLETQLLLLTAEEEARFRILAVQLLSAEATDAQIAQAAELIELIDKETATQKAKLITIEEIDKEFTRGIGAAFTTFFTNIDEGFDGLRDSFSQLLTDLAAQILTNIIITQFLNALPGGGIVGGLVNLAGGAAQGSQFGGPALPGVPQIVGEGNRPEVFIPSQAGRVEPMAALGGATTVIVVNEQDPKALVATLNSQDGVRVQRNFVQTEQRSVKRTLGLR